MKKYRVTITIEWTGLVTAGSKVRAEAEALQNAVESGEVRSVDSEVVSDDSEASHDAPVFPIGVCFHHPACNEFGVCEKSVRQRNVTL